MREVEVKILEVSKPIIEKKLRRAGAKKLFSKKMSAIYFDFPNRKLKRAGKVLRLRKEGKNAVLCVKTKRKSKKAKDLNEFEVEVSSFANAEKMLALLGFIEVMRVEKTRTSYKIGAAKLELDKIKGVPLFVEIEASSISQLLKTARKLGFSKEQLLPWTNFDVLSHYKKV